MYAESNVTYLNVGAIIKTFTPKRRELEVIEANSPKILYRLKSRCYGMLAYRDVMPGDRRS